jgi:hypothetical protein
MYSCFFSSNNRYSSSRYTYTGYGNGSGNRSSRRRFGFARSSVTSYDDNTYFYGRNRRRPHYWERERERRNNLNRNRNNRRNRRRSPSPGLYRFFSDKVHILPNVCNKLLHDKDHNCPNSIHCNQIKFKNGEISVYSSFSIVHCCILY